MHPALVQVAAQDVRPLRRGRAARYGLARTAAGFEHAALAAALTGSAARPGRGQVELAVPAF
jgi:hypothetical protein